MDSDDVPGAPITAVMSFETWKNRYNRDASVVGSTFKINTRPVTIVGIAPERYFGDRVLKTPPEFYLPLETMPEVAHAPYVHNSEMQWLYLIGRVRPGVQLEQLNQKVNAILIQQLRSDIALQYRGIEIGSQEDSRRSQSGRRRDSGDAAPI